MSSWFMTWFTLCPWLVRDALRDLVDNNGFQRATPANHVTPSESKLVNILTRRTTLILLCCGVNRFICSMSSVHRFIPAMRQACWWVLDLSGACTFPSGFCFFLLMLPGFYCYVRNSLVALPEALFAQQVLLCFGHVWRRISHILGTPEPKKSYYRSGPSPMRQSELWICQDTEPPGLCLGLVVNGVSCGSVRRGRGGDRYSQRRS